LCASLRNFRTDFSQKKCVLMNICSTEVIQAKLGTFHTKLFRYSWMTVA
jgi:hypothetical protein